jgi:hypothetical protein
MSPRLSNKRRPTHFSANTTADPLVSETVARRAAEVFDFRFVTEVNLKGFGNKVRVYELLAKER